MTEPVRRKLIEVALPLEAINRESVREKAIRHGHPSTLHVWWARRPLAACRAVLFAQLVDDPSAHPDEFPTEGLQEAERRRLFALIERLVVWENTTDERLLAEAHAEILKSTNGNPPSILDPFAGGGSIPLEAQRLGLESHASDLNPVPVLINKALIEFPPKFAGQPPVHPGAAESRLGPWTGATGIAEDVRRYGQWICDEAEKRIGHLYPKATLPDGSSANVIAWIWARTVACPNPGCGIEMPLTRSFWLGKKKGKEAYIVPTLRDGHVEFSIGHNLSTAPAKDSNGTAGRTGGVCVGCGTAVPLTYVRSEGTAGRMGSQLMAVVAEGNRRRIYLRPTCEHESGANVPIPDDVPDTDLSTHPQYMGVPRYGLTRHRDLFTPRQLTALTTLSDLVRESRERVLSDALASGQAEGESLEDGGLGARAYADCITTYLGLVVSKVADNSSNLCAWRPDTGKEGIGHVFARQAISFVWDYAEANVFQAGPANFASGAEWLAKAIERLPADGPVTVTQADAATREYGGVLVSTDPPYYDNVPYADLADFFYVWLRRSLGAVHPALLGTILTPKHAELVADSQRLGGRDKAAKFFQHGFEGVFSRIHDATTGEFPTVVYYAFKQTETDGSGTASTGWELLLEGMIRSGWAIVATWPMRTELGNRTRSLGSNTLASSIVLACRPRSASAEATNRRGFIAAMKAELPSSLRHMQQGSVAPVDLAQAAIGPGMAVFTRYGRVVEADGSDMTVRTALALINQVLDEVLSEQEGDFDADTRFCVKWFSQYAWDEDDSGTADTLSRATNTSLAGMQRSGVFRAVAGKASLIAPEELPENWDPLADDRISVWEVAMHIADTLNAKGVEAAAALMATAGQRVDLGTVQELAYLLYNICERHGWTKSAMLFNSLGTSWSDLDAASRSRQTRGAATQSAFTFEDN